MGGLRSECVGINASSRQEETRLSYSASGTGSSGANKTIDFLTSREGRSGKTYGFQGKMINPVFLRLCQSPSKESEEERTRTSLKLRNRDNFYTKEVVVLLDGPRL